VNTRRTLAIVALLAITALALLQVLHRAQNPRENAEANGRASNESAPSGAPGAHEGTVDRPLQSATTAGFARDLIDRDPETAARLWRSRSENVLRTRNRKEFGDEVAALLERPYDEAWGPLMEKAKAGDVRAALAATHVQSICTAESTRGAESHQRERPASSYYKNLPEAMKPFVDRLAELDTKLYEQRVAHCSGIDHSDDPMSLLFDNFLRPDNVDAQIEVAGTNADKGQAIADLRAIVEAQDSARARLVLADTLMRSGNGDQHEEGRAMLAQLASGDPMAANLLAYCLQAGCDGASPDAAAARTWFEISAGLGDLEGLSWTEHALADAGDNAGAWAWSVYALDLALDGCFEIIYPSHRHLASAAQTEAQRKAGLTPAEQNAGLAISYAIEGRWEKQAKERLACD
jgi:hypothetical protein